MIRVYVDSGSSIKENEKASLNVEILPLKIIFDEQEYLDGINLTFADFYDRLINKKQFPKTSLPKVTEIVSEIEAYTKAGDDVIFLTLSASISGTYNLLRLVFEDNPKVHIIDSKVAVGGIRLLVLEINKYRNLGIDVVLDKVNALIPRIKVIAIPESLTYLHRGGRLSKVGYYIGTIAHIVPLITFKAGKVATYLKVRGMRQAIKALIKAFDDFECDLSYPIIPSYTYCPDNLCQVIEMLNVNYQNQLIAYDNLSMAIAAHWGPNAFGFIFVGNAN